MISIITQSILFLAFLGVWVINIGILYYSGLYLSPVALEHASGAGDVAGVVLEAGPHVDDHGAASIEALGELVAPRRIELARYLRLDGGRHLIAAALVLLALGFCWAPGSRTGGVPAGAPFGIIPIPPPVIGTCPPS